MRMPVPPAVRRVASWVVRSLRSLRRPKDTLGEASETITFVGDFASWADAEQQATGYDAPVILERTREALLKVKRGEAVFERDAYILDHPEYPFPVIAALLRAASLEGGRLAVVDFGGSLGSTYFQCQGLLRGAVQSLEWTVVEQSAHVACGREYFETQELRFFETIDQALVLRPNTLLLSGVLQYLPEPHALLAECLAHQIRHVIVDRTPFLRSDRDRLTIQHVPEWLYPASYPAWFFGETRFLRLFESAGYRLVADFPGADNYSPPGDAAYFKGFIFEKLR
jgi:putative methyltransferase (TIGR04325 family)